MSKKMANDKLILEKLDKLDARIDKIDITLSEQKVSLDYHIKRSDQADAAIDILNQKLRPIEDHVLNLKTIWTTLGTIATILGGIGGVILFVFSVYQFILPLTN